ncbi:hypothetical protein XocBAI15_06915 [Xanthomonas oryzae pv. oryzicola]|nr:hypothetical protein BE73_03375 [Xanthomonas oryzae pv. oryzicola]AKO05861.1 hypothetical protein ACU16_18900 [Xanthomonas oryzae pv. oryzicola]AKO07215.1 hypothetical protein ACU17_03025 [Xanthomonas oryzae pv. oryzicola]OWB28427.1 hypothetical protein XocBAI15_06915 [Xanthomonas oryzae pv. oryzicola]OWB31609.1 hypothetical protein XocBAI20_06415 [Xanthomonas oryzae pv. oryzicola]
MLLGESPCSACTSRRGASPTSHSTPLAHMAKSEQMHQASHHPMLRGSQLLPLLFVLLRLLLRLL